MCVYLDMYGVLLTHIAVCVCVCFEFIRVSGSDLRGCRIPGLELRICHVDGVCRCGPSR